MLAELSEGTQTRGASEMTDLQVRAMREAWNQSGSEEKDTYTAQEFALLDTGRCSWNKDCTVVDTEKAGSLYWSEARQAYVKMTY